jgi:predicted transcriptional regulator
MARVPFTLRIDTKERAALQHLSKVEGRPINQLLNEAIKVYLTRQGRKERDLETNLASLRAYRKQDPGFRHAIAAFVEAEASHDDPAEGVPVEGQFVEGDLQPGPVQSKIRDILGA